LLIGQIGCPYDWKAQLATPDLFVLIESLRKPLLHLGEKLKEQIFNLMSHRVNEAAGRINHRRYAPYLVTRALPDEGKREKQQYNYRCT
jgi:hypothetical protein